MTAGPPRLCKVGILLANTLDKRWRKPDILQSNYLTSQPVLPARCRASAKLVTRHSLRVTTMSLRPPPARAPAALLRDAKPLKALFSEAKRLDRLQRLLESQLQPAAREHCRVASWREGTLLLIVTDGHWATRLRYQERRLQRQLQNIEAFSGLNRILFRVQPPETPRHTPGPAPELSVQAADNIQETARGIRDPNLKAALERLASHARSAEGDD